VPQFSVKLSVLIDRLRLTPVFMPKDASSIEVTSTEVNRPGLQLAGFYEFFDSQRIQILGKGEFAYLEMNDAETYRDRVYDFFSRRPIATIVARSLPISPVMLGAAMEFGCPLLTTDDTTSGIVSELISTLNVELAPRITRHGVLVEVHGEGILLMGDSGVGKSETAMELIKRGHRLIADDAVEIRRVSARTLVGSSPENIRHFMELRGIGIINVRRIFGIGSVKVTQHIDMIIMLEHWDNEKKYDRMGLEGEYTEILGNRIPSLTIPVKPGRNLAIIIEVAAMNNRQKEMGYNSAQELLGRLGMADDIPDSIPGKYDEWNR